MHRSVFQAFFILCLLTGCASRQDTGPVIPEGDFDLALPATFSGELPCADCDGILMTLNLRPDNLYQMRKKFKGKSTVESQIGYWRHSVEDNLIILGKKKGSLKTYAIQSSDHLRFLDYQAEKPSEQISYELHRQPGYDPFGDTVKMRGMYRFDGTRGTFSECISGTVFTVTEEADSKKLERAYLNTPHGPDEALLTSIHGRLTMQPDEALVVEHFTRLYPGRDCSGEVVTASLTGTSWQLLEVEGTPVTLDEDMKKPFFFLEKKGNQVKGFGGCNRFFGTYLMKGDVFVFNKIASTRMACRKGSSVEEALFTVLDSTETFRIEDDILILLDREGVERAKLLATP